MIYKPDNLKDLEENLKYLQDREYKNLDIRHTLNKVFIHRYENIEACGVYWVRRDMLTYNSDCINFKYRFNQSYRSRGRYIMNHIQYKLLSTYIRT